MSTLPQCLAVTHRGRQPLPTNFKGPAHTFLDIWIRRLQAWVRFALRLASVQAHAVVTTTAPGAGMGRAR
jgi:hypothetical protein